MFFCCIAGRTAVGIAAFVPGTVGHGTAGHRPCSLLDSRWHLQRDGC